MDTSWQAGALLWFAFFQCVYWATHFVSRMISPVYRELSYYERNYWCTCIAAIVHGAVLCIQLLPFFPGILGKESGWMWQAGILDTRPEIQAANICFFAYCTHDLLCLVDRSVVNLPKIPKGDDIAFAVHHVCILFVWYSFLTESHGHIFALPTMLTEVTALFTNGHWLLKKWGLGSSVLFTINGVCMLVSWYYMRIWGYVTVVAIRLFELRGEAFDPASEIFGRNMLLLANWLAGCALQLFWGWKMTYMALKMVGVLGPTKPKDKDGANQKGTKPANKQS